MPATITKPSHRFGVSCLALAGLMACSNVQPPRDELSAAELAVSQAESGKAAQYAPLELRLARDKLTAARQAMDDEDYVTARRLSEQALIDAQLAEAKAHSASSQQTAQEMRQTIETLRHEAERTSPTAP